MAPFWFYSGYDLTNRPWQSFVFVVDISGLLQRYLIAITHYYMVGISIRKLFRFYSNLSYVENNKGRERMFFS